MYSQACVKNSVHRGEVYTPGRPPPPPRRPLQRTVRILLECVLVKSITVTQQGDLFSGKQSGSWLTCMNSSRDVLIAGDLNVCLYKLSDKGLLFLDYSHQLGLYDSIHC